MNDRIMISGTNSGCGKTTVTLALLSALKNLGLHPQAFKCGPDYIDPMFHRKALGIPSHNLDPFFSAPDQLRSRLSASGGQNEGISVIEGVMGYYDGIGTEGRASSYSVASAAEIPVILVINARGMYTSAAAVLRGFKEFHKDSWIRGVIFNNISPMIYSGLASIAENAGVKPLGFLPKDPYMTIGSRHLGLITADEIEDIDQRLSRLGEAAEKNFDIDGILETAALAPSLESPPQAAPSPDLSAGRHPVIAVAQDEAFCFIYDETLETLKALGAELKYFSPIHDRAVPYDASALYLPGGYPELFAEELSSNSSMIQSVRDCIICGMPTIAECGGFLYLHKHLDGYNMVGIFDADANKTERLQHFGYVTIKAEKDNLLCLRGQNLRAHEFHYYDSTDYGSSFTAEKASNGRTYPCVHAGPSLYAGFPHLYLSSEPDAAQRYLDAAVRYMEEHDR